MGKSIRVQVVGVFALFLLLCPLFFMRVPASHAMDGCICNGSSSCYPDGCTRKTILSDGSIDYTKCANAGCGGVYNACYINGNLTVANYFCVTQPPCCADMVARNNPEACCWPERAFCHPVTTCNKLTNPERCGWYWTFHQDWTNRAEGYGCMKGPNANSMVPIFGLPAGVPGYQPTATPAPTAVPTVIPTAPPTPTIPVPTSAPIIPTAPAPTSIPFSIATPIPTVSVKNSSSSSVSGSPTLPLSARIGLRMAIINADKGFRAVGNAYFFLRRADSNLEEYINGLLWKLLSYIGNH